MKDMWSEIIEYLKDASLVASIQEAFGVKILHTREVILRNVDVLNYHLSNLGESRKNGFITYAQIANELTNRNPHYTISNFFWYYLFLFGTELGDEIFYCTFIPFWFWNIDGTVGRRIVSVWAIVMTTGQMLKDIICWPRPASPPVVRLQAKWSEEYGMPSTHAMIAISIPFSVVLFTMNRYIYPLSIGWTIASLWSILVCMSRLYLGMHTVLDIVAGVMLTIALMIPLIPLVDMIDYCLFTNIGMVVALICISIAVLIYYPCGEKWTPTRGDTAMVLSVTVGIYLGTWLNYSTGKMTSALSPPYPIIWPSSFMCCCLILRTLLGFFTVFLTRIVWKSLSYKVVCAILGVNFKDLLNSQICSENKNKVLADLVHKYVTCFMIGVNTVYFLPIIFTIIGIGRPTFYTEV